MNVVICFGKRNYWKYKQCSKTFQAINKWVIQPLLPRYPTMQLGPWDLCAFGACPSSICLAGPSSLSVRPWGRCLCDIKPRSGHLCLLKIHCEAASAVFFSLHNNWYLQSQEPFLPLVTRNLLDGSLVALSWKTNVFGFILYHLSESKVVMMYLQRKREKNCFFALHSNFPARLLDWY